jgi:predicted Zn-dependent peptidase
MSPSQNGATNAQLDNGLEIRLKPIRTAPLVSSWIWYRVGSRYERPGSTGISHWVEHMQFKGTPKFPAGLMDRLVSRVGGQWNAFTWLDWTAYFETLPMDRVELALELEADRMRNSLFEAEEVETERTVIISERQGHENDPTFRLSEEVQATAFRVHSYHHEVIGDMADLQSEKRVTVEGPGETPFIEIVYRAPSATSDDFVQLAVLDSILSGASSLNLFGGGISNKTSRLYKRLVEGELAAAVHGGLAATVDPYLYSIRVTVRPDRKPEDALKALDEEIEKLLDEPISQEDLSKAAKQARALFAYGSESITNQGFWLGYSEMFADYAWFETFLERLEQVTPEQMREVARARLLPSKRVVGTYLPAKGGVNG